MVFRNRCAQEVERLGLGIEEDGTQIHTDVHRNKKERTARLNSDENASVTVKPIYN
jgi:hypothetical protein